MSTSDALASDRLSSILFALKRIWPSAPQKVVWHLRNPKHPNDYRYLDALSALCSFVPRCDSASIVIEAKEHSNCLHISTRPSAPSTLRSLMPTWIGLIQSLPGATPPPSSFDPSPEQISSLDPSTPDNNFVVQVYRACHKTLLEYVAAEGSDILKDISELQDWDLKDLADRDPNHLASTIEALMEMEKGGPTFSPMRFLQMHYAVRTVASYIEPFSYYSLVKTARGLSRAVDTIIAFATSEENHATIKLPWSIVWVDASGDKEVQATADEQELGKMLKWPRYEDVSHEIASLAIPRGFKALEDSTTRFKGRAHMHCESALIYHILTEELVVYDYIGCSEPTCYACLVLMRAFNKVSKEQKLTMGCRSGKIDATWLCPPVANDIYEAFVGSLCEDLPQLCNQFFYYRDRVVSLVKEDL